MITVEEALQVFGNLNAFRENPTSIPPHFPEPRQLNEACEVVNSYLQNAIVLTGKDIQTITYILMDLSEEDDSPALDSPEYYNEALKRFNEKRK